VKQLYEIAGLYPDEIMRDREKIKSELVSAYDTKLKIFVQEELEEVSRQLKKTKHHYKRENWCTSWWSQFTVLLERGLKERRHESFSTLKIMQVFIASILSGILWFQSQGRVHEQVHMLVFHPHISHCTDKSLHNTIFSYTLRLKYHFTGGVNFQYALHVELHPNL
jgi:hypothetical protein